MIGVIPLIDHQTLGFFYTGLLSLQILSAVYSRVPKSLHYDITHCSGHFQSRLSRLPPLTFSSVHFTIDQAEWLFEEIAHYCQNGFLGTFSAIGYYESLVFEVGPFLPRVRPFLPQI